LALRLGCLQVFDGSVIGAAKAGFVAGEEGEGAAFLGESFEGVGETGSFIEGAVPAAQGFILLIHGFVEESGFDGPDAAQAPAGVGNVKADFDFEIVRGPV
jgi:hypothetical protein